MADEIGCNLITVHQCDAMQFMPHRDFKVYLNVQSLWGKQIFYTDTTLKFLTISFNISPFKYLLTLLLWRLQCNVFLPTY